MSQSNKSTHRRSTAICGLAKREEDRGAIIAGYCALSPRATRGPGQRRMVGWLEKQFVIHLLDVCSAATTLRGSPVTGPTQHQHLQPSLGSCSTGVDLITRYYSVASLPPRQAALTLFRTYLQQRTQNGPSPHDKARCGGVGRWVSGPVGSRACASFSRSSRHPSPAQYELLARLRTGTGATDWLLGLRFWRSSSGDGSVLFPQYISGTLTSHTLLKHNWPAMSDRQQCCWSTSRQLNCFTPHHLITTDTPAARLKLLQEFVKTSQLEKLPSLNNTKSLSPRKIRSAVEAPTLPIQVDINPESVIGSSACAVQHWPNLV